MFKKSHQKIAGSWHHRISELSLTCLCLCLCVCVCVSMAVSVCVYVYISLCVCSLVCVCVCISVCLYVRGVCVCICVYISVCLYVRSVRRSNRRADGSTTRSVRPPADGSLAAEVAAFTVPVCSIPPIQYSAPPPSSSPGPTTAEQTPAY